MGSPAGVDRQAEEGSPEQDKAVQGRAVGGNLDQGQPGREGGSPASAQLGRLAVEDRQRTVAHRPVHYVNRHEHVD